MGIYHRAFIDVCSDIDIGRRHHDYRRRQIGSDPDAASAGNDAHTVFRSELACRDGIFVIEGKLALAHVGEASHTEAGENFLLYLRIDFPLTVYFFGHSYPAAFKVAAKLGEFIFFCHNSFFVAQLMFRKL